MLDTTRDARKTFRWFILAFLLSMVVLVSGAGIFFFEGLDQRGGLAHSSWRSGAMFILTLALLLAAAMSAIAFALYQRAQRKHIEGQLSDVRRGIRERDTTLKLLHLLNQRSSTHELIQGIAELIREWMGCDAVGVRLHEGEDYPYAETSGLSPEFVRKERYLCERDSQGRLKCDCDGNPVLDCMCGTVLRGATDPARPFFTAKGSFWTNCTTEMLAATTEEDRQGRTRATCNAEGYESGALIPLRCGGETLGLLQINDRARNRFTAEHIFFLEGAADSIAISLAQRQAQAELKESETHYRSLFGNMLNGFAFCKMLKDGRLPNDFLYLEVNEAFEKLTGLTDVIGRRVSDVIPGIQESDPELLERYARVAATGVPEKFEIFMVSMQMWFSVSVYCPRKGFFVSVFDVITERKQTEAARQLLSSAVEHAADMIVIIDRAGIIQYANPAFEAATGFTRQEIIGRPAGTVLPGSEDPALAAALSGGLTGGTSWQGRVSSIRKNGARFWMDATIAPVRNDEGRILNFVGVAHDSTNELQLQEQLRQAQKMESVGRLAGGVAHDFNNMLQVIHSYVEISLSQVDAATPLAKNLVQIRSAAERSAELVRQLLTFARKQTVTPKTVNLNDAIARTLSMLRRLIGENIELSWVPGDFPGCVRIDPSQLDQVLANLAANARDAIDGVGKLSIETCAREFDAAYCAAHTGFSPGRYLQLAVSDSGRGIDVETMSHLFEPFFTTKQIGEGTGLGLATVYGIVKQNSGFINVYSEPGRGTTFKIYLPVFEGLGSPPREHGTGGAIPRGTETLLVVEDEPSILKLTNMMLESLGYTVLTALAPKEALRQVGERTGAIDLLITDVVMPEMNGRELAVAIAQVRPELKCLYVSGHTADIIARQGIIEEGVHFLSKPFTIATLGKKVREILG